jgi:putative protein kinase ArgK-like GTPase of G3E family
MAAGYRIAADRGHVTAIDAADALTGGRHHGIFLRLHRLRRRRHEFMYKTPADPGQQELSTARADVIELIGIASGRIGPTQERPGSPASSGKPCDGRITPQTMRT